MKEIIITFPENLSDILFIVNKAENQIFVNKKYIKSYKKYGNIKISRVSPNLKGLHCNIATTGDEFSSYQLLLYC
jgi:hypothetical protein